MSDENLTPPVETAAVAAPVSPDVSFLRSWISRARAIVQDPKNKLQGSARLTAEIISRSGQILAPRSRFEEMQQWQADWDALQKIVNDHTTEKAQAAFAAQQKTLHVKIAEPGYAHSTIFSTEDMEQKYEFIRDSAIGGQRELYAKHIETARIFAAAAVELLASHAVSLEKSQRDLYTRYGIPFAGSPLVAAVNKAKTFVLGRVTGDSGNAGPDLVLPWLIL